MKTKRKTTNKESEKKKLSLMPLIIPASAVLLALILNIFVIISAIVPSASMADTLEEISFIIGSRLAYLSSVPERGDVVIFEKDELEADLIVKRVIGLPGETVEIRSGRVYINGSDTPLEEEYVDAFSEDSEGPYVVPEGEYFMLGDNRCESFDSRFWDYKFVPLSDVKAKVILKLWPRVKKF
ncbi:MAG: signal peptidase I [Clostridia bacterium]|nr:signal peptidase I [Clostridia bacterium]